MLTLVIGLSQVRDVWAHTMQRMKKFKDVRVRIVARRDKRGEATAEELAVMMSDKCDFSKQVTAAEIAGAYHKGEEVSCVCWILVPRNNHFADFLFARNCSSGGCNARDSTKGSCANWCCGSLVSDYIRCNHYGVACGCRMCSAVRSRTMQ